MTIKPCEDPSVGPEMRGLLRKDPKLSIADAQLALVCRRLPRLLIFCVLFMVGMAFALKNDASKGKSGTERMSWIGEWVEPGESCNGSRYRIRKQFYAEPGQDLQRISFRRTPKKDMASFILKDGSTVEVRSQDWMTLEWLSDATAGTRILKRCLSPFMFGRH